MTTVCNIVHIFSKKLSYFGFKLFWVCFEWIFWGKCNIIWYSTVGLYKFHWCLCMVTFGDMDIWYISGSCTVSRNIPSDVHSFSFCAVTGSKEEGMTCATCLHLYCGFNRNLADCIEEHQNYICGLDFVIKLTWRLRLCFISKVKKEKLINFCSRISWKQHRSWDLRIYTV